MQKNSLALPGAVAALQFGSDFYDRLLPGLYFRPLYAGGRCGGERVGAPAGEQAALLSFRVLEAHLERLLLTPGIYPLDGPIRVARAATVVLGLGLATLLPVKGTPALTIADVPGVSVAGLLVDAGPVNSPVLVEVGPRGSRGDSGP